MPGLHDDNHRPGADRIGITIAGEDCYEAVSLIGSALLFAVDNGEKFQEFLDAHGASCICGHPEDHIANTSKHATRLAGMFADIIAARLEDQQRQQQGPAAT